MFVHKTNSAAVLAAFTMLLGGSAQAGIGTNSWQIVAPQGGSFSILMPGQPKLSVTRGKNASKLDWESHSFVYKSPNGNESYRVGYGEYGVTLDVKASLDNATKLAIDNGTKLWEHNETLNGHAGRKVAVTDGKVVWVSEFYVAGSRIYEATYTSRDLLKAVVSAVPFLQSFQITQ